MDGDTLQPSDQENQSPSVLASVLSSIFSAWNDWATVSHATEAAAAYSVGLAARGEHDGPSNFDPNVKVDRHARAPSKEVRQAMDWASGVYGLNPDYTRRIIYYESARTFDPTIKNKFGYAGLGQFGPDTWDMTMDRILKDKPDAAREWLKKKGFIDDQATDRAVANSWRSITKNTTSGQWTTPYWKDADLNALATVANTEYDMGIIKAKVGIDNPTVGQAYALHLLGSGDGMKLLQALHDHNENALATSVGINARSLEANHLGGFTVGQVMTTLDKWMASMPDFNSMPQSEELILVSGTSADTAIGKALGERTDIYCNTPYLMGGNTLGPGGGIDCSHFVRNNTTTIMQKINDMAGKQIFDVTRMGKLLATADTNSEVSHGRLSGGQYLALRGAGYSEYSEKDIRSGNVGQGTILFVNNGDGIEHVAQVTQDKQGHLQVSQSGGSNNHSVNNETFAEWMRKHSSSSLRAINPFQLPEENNKDLQALFDKHEAKPDAAPTTGQQAAQANAAPTEQAATTTPAAPTVLASSPSPVIVPPPPPPGQATLYIGGDSLANGLGAAVEARQGSNRLPNYAHVANVADGSSGYGVANDGVGGIQRSDWTVKNARPGEAVPPGAAAFASWRADTERKLGQRMPQDSAKFADWITDQHLLTPQDWTKRGLTPPPYGQTAFTQWLTDSHMQNGDSYVLFTGRNNHASEEEFRTNIQSTVANLAQAQAKGVNVLMVGQLDQGDINPARALEMTKYQRDLAHEKGIPFLDAQKGILYLPGNAQPIQLAAGNLGDQHGADHVHLKDYDPLAKVVTAAVKKVEEARTPTHAAAAPAAVTTASASAPTPAAPKSEKETAAAPAPVTAPAAGTATFSVTLADLKAMVVDAVNVALQQHDEAKTVQQEAGDKTSSQKVLATLTKEEKKEKKEKETKHAANTDGTRQGHHYPMKHGEKETAVASASTGPTRGVGSGSAPSGKPGVSNA